MRNIIGEGGGGLVTRWTRLSYLGMCKVASTSMLSNWAFAIYIMLSNWAFAIYIYIMLSNWAFATYISLC